MDKDELLRFITLIMERHGSHTYVLDQLLQILEEQNAPEDYKSLVKDSMDAFRFVKEALVKKGFLTEADIRNAEAKERRIREQYAGRC